MKAYFVRHGQTIYNTRGLVNSDPSKDVHLTELGKEQSEQAADKLKEKNIDVIFVSPLPRTRQTANIINVYHDSPVKVDKRLTDRITGLEGEPYMDFLKSVEKDVFNTRPEGGESFQDEKRRIHSFLGDLKQMDYDTVLVISHEEPMQIISGYFRGLSDEEIYELKITNCQILEFDL